MADETRTEVFPPLSPPKPAAAGGGCGRESDSADSLAVVGLSGLFSAVAGEALRAVGNPASPDAAPAAARRAAAVVAPSDDLHATLTAARIGTWEWSLVDGTVAWSEMQYRLLGYEPFSVEPSFEAFRRRLHPDDAMRGHRDFQAALAAGRPYDTEYRVVWPNGEVHWLQSRGRFLFDDSDRAVRMTGVTLDLDRLKEAEQAASESHERLKTIAEATPGTIFTYRLTPDGRRSFPFATSHLRDTHGVDPVEAARDPSLLLARIHPDDAEAVASSSAESARAMSMWHSRFRHKHPEKGEVWLEAYASPIRENDGTVTWHGIAHDITEMKRAEHELLEARRKAEAADRAKSEFLANMSHEIRTPMSAIMGYADILSDRLHDPDNLQCLDTIRNNGRYLLEIIDDILDLSRIEAGKLELSLERVRPDRIVRDVKSLLKLRAADKGLALNVEFEGPLPETIATDPTRLRQILINLVENAIKFTDRGEVRIVVRLLAAESKLEFEVIDTGVGIPFATLQKLFRPFTQADSSVTRRFGGSGLGLSICRGLARMLGGGITVTTRVGEGSRFTLTVAAGDLSEVRLVDAVPSDPAPVDLKRRFRPLACKVLVVDDRREMRFLAQHMLEEAGAEVVHAVDGRDALDRALAAEDRGCPFDAVLLDMQMPVLDGYEAAKELRRRGFERPIVALTANAMKEDERKCLASGCDAYLSKPLDRTTLVDTIAQYTQDVTLAELAARRAASAASSAGGAAPDASRGERSDSDADGGEPRGRNVLLVDDNEDTCRMLKMLLKGAGFDVAVASDGEAAVGAAADRSFDFVVLDLGLPGMSGAEVLVALKGRLERCRFICLSGRSEAEVDWRRLGFHHFLRKPTRFDELRRLLSPAPDVRA